MTFTPEFERVLNDAVFVICALVALVSAGLVITRRNPVYATFMLLPMFIAMAVLFVLLSAPFMAAMQVLVYGGAIVVVFLFVIMLLNLGPEDLLSEGGPGRWIVAGIAGALLFGLMAAPVVTAFTRDGALKVFPGQDGKPVAQFESETTAGREQNGIAFHESLKPGTLTLVIEHATEEADQIKLHDNGRGAFVLLEPDPWQAGELLFSVPWVDSQDVFKKGALSKKLKGEFKKREIKFLDSTKIRWKVKGERCRITAGAKAFIVKKKGETLNIYTALRLEDSSIDYSTGEWKLNFGESLSLPKGQEIQASIAPLPEAFGGVVRAKFGSTKAIAGAMFQNYLVPFELAGILLVVGIMGALLLSKERLRRLGDDTDTDADTAADGTTEEETHV